MRQKIGINQTGYALLLMVVALMGLGGAVMTGFTLGVKQQTEHERYLHNQRVLEDAKRALLQYAYNYPQLGPGQDDGPGRLLCPDTDNDGFEDGNIDCIDTTSGAPVAMVGRFPWKDARLNFHEAKDASGEVLWFAVSSNFARGLNSLVNSDTNGTIAIEDRSGALLHPATFAVDVFGAGVAAVIFAPGPAIARDGVVQDRVADDIDPENYLDKFSATVDNATFVNADANDPPDGFVTGPIFNPVDGSLAVNDQMIVITAAEVIAMAEKATLQAYRESIKDYLARTSGVYPWLYNYDGIEYNVGGGESVDVAIDKLSSYFPAFTNFTDEDDYLGFDTSGNDGIFGRIPSIFANYFTEATSQPFESQLTGGSLTFIDPGASDSVTLTETYCKDGCPQGTGGSLVFEADLVDDGPILEFETSQILTDVRFVDTTDASGRKNGRITAKFPAPDSIPFDLYFWDEDSSPTGIWTACPDGADQLLDCSRDSVGNPTPGSVNGLKSRILHLQGILNFSGVENFDFDYNTAPTIAWTPATAVSHAAITGTYPAAAIVSFPGTFSAVTYKFEQHWHAGDSSLDPNDTSYTTGTVDMGGFTVNSVTLGFRYFPELPGWAFTNDWHNSIRMAYALEYAPPGTGSCMGDITCLYLEDSAGAPQNVISLLVIGGLHDWTDTDVDGELADEVADNMGSVFDNGNTDDNRTFYRHRDNDKLLVIDRL
jgi:hypothetical protein